MNARAAVKSAIGHVALAPGVVGRTRSSLHDRVNVAYLHYVGGYEPYYDGYYTGLTLERFDRDLTRLARHFDFRPLREVVSDTPPSGSAPTLAITFDDGFDLLRNGVLDVLDRHGVKATTFVVTSTLGNTNLMWRNKLCTIRALSPQETYLHEYNEMVDARGLPPIAVPAAMMRESERWPQDLKDALCDELWQRCGLPELESFLAEHTPYLTWDGLRTLLERGHDVGLHTHTHPYCSRLGPEEVEAEVVAPAALLRARLGLDFLPFSYPFGVRLRAETERALCERGVFDAAFGIEGFSPRGTPNHRLERAPIERELLYPVFGKALLARPARSLA